MSVTETRGRRRAWLLLGAVALVVLILDQLTKQAIIDSISPGEAVDIILGIEFVHSQNSGIAFGFLSGGGGLVPLLGFVVLGIVLFWFWHNPFLPFAWLATGLIAGGALGNLVDRVRHGAVTDFISVGSFPSFNLADSAITCGVVLFMLLVIFGTESDDR